RHFEDLRSDKHLRGLAVIAPNLVNAESHAILFGGILQFRDSHRDAVDQEHDIVLLNTVPFCRHSSVTWNTLFSGFSKSMTLMLRSRFSSGTKTDCSPRSHECASRLPSMAGLSRFIRRRMSGVRLRSTTLGFRRTSCASRIPLK